jgi:DNA-directed RNA polymerase specialized sigma24 family protein
MSKNYELLPEDFENLLGWFSSDREQAGLIYEEIRRGLIRYFRFRGCSEEERLADEALNRAARRSAEFFSDKNIEPAVFIYGFARNICREHFLRRRREIELNPALNYTPHDSDRASGSEDRQQKCLENCLKTLPEADSRLIIRYYSENKAAKIELRRIIAQELGLNSETLHMRMYRIRKKLKKCVHRCLNEK